MATAVYKRNFVALKHASSSNLTDQVVCFCIILLIICKQQTMKIVLSYYKYVHFNSLLFKNNF